MTIEQLSIDLNLTSGLSSALFRYETLQRVSKCLQRNQSSLLAWGFADNQLRLVVEGRDERSVPNLLRALKVGTQRAALAAGHRVAPATELRQALAESEVAQAIAWAHQAPVDAGASGPLASPWSSHRDLMGFRPKSHVNLARQLELVDPQQVHAMCGGRALPAGWPPPLAERENLNLLLRVAASVLGVLPADRKCFRLFVQLAKSRGWANEALADALALSTRRIRQLAAAQEPYLAFGQAHLSDPRLRLVP